MPKKPDFEGWATKNDLRCSDGRTIRKDAFAGNDGKSVPMVWNHQHNEPYNILGHALLKNMPGGVRALGFFNDTDSGQTAKALVQSEDITELSIFANGLMQKGADVIHGDIKELSLVLAGANPGAFIDTIMQHGEGSGEMAIITTGEVLVHSDETETPPEDIPPVEPEVPPVEPIPDVPPVEPTVETPSVEPEVPPVVPEIPPTPEVVIEHADTTLTPKVEPETPSVDQQSEETIADVYNTLSPKQQVVVCEIVAQALEQNQDTTIAQSGIQNNENIEGGTPTMKRNIFDKEGKDISNTLSHSDIEGIVLEAKHIGSMKDAFLAHGITNIDYLFPDAQTVMTPPGFISRDMTWVSGVMGGVHHTPFSRIKSIFANITENDARARGYIKGNKKVDEVFALLKRVTTPCTVYKHQSLDRDDVIDITDFDVVAWLKTEMRMMLDEEIARAILVGDGRSPSSDDKINELNIRPIWTDDDLYTIKRTIPVAANITEDDLAKTFEKVAVKARKDYKGSGNVTLYTTEDILTDCLLREDGMGRRMYASVTELATALRVTNVVTVPVMENLTRTGSDSKVYTLLGIIVNLRDYNVGADKGGAVNMFDDFDIDYNKQKYLIETRCSGALTVPYSAIVIESVPAA